MINDKDGGGTINEDEIMEVLYHRCAHLVLTPCARTVCAHRVRAPCAHLHVRTHACTHTCARGQVWQGCDADVTGLGFKGPGFRVQVSGSRVEGRGSRGDSFCFLVWYGKDAMQKMKLSNSLGEYNIYMLSNMYCCTPQVWQGCDAEDDG